MQGNVRENAGNIVRDTMHIDTPHDMRALRTDQQLICRSNTHMAPPLSEFLSSSLNSSIVSSSSFEGCPEEPLLALCAGGWLVHHLEIVAAALAAGGRRFLRTQAGHQLAAKARLGAFPLHPPVPRGGSQYAVCLAQNSSE